jgi:AraC family transcriptional activator of pobA
MQNVKKITFQNKNKPTSHFDILNLEELFNRKDLGFLIDDSHKVDFYIIIVIEKGSGNHTIDFKDYQCSERTILTIRKDQTHKFFRNDSIKGSVILFTDEFLVSHIERLENLGVTQLFNDLLSSPKLQLNPNDFSEIQKISQRIKSEFFEKNDNYSMNIIRSELHILTTKLFRIKSNIQNLDTGRKYLKEFIEFQNLVEHNVNAINKVKDYANKIGVSTKTLKTTTREVINKSAKEFIDDIRIKQIKRLLINTDLSIKEIAYNTGFEETTNSYKYFKRHTQTTPEQFRLAY